MLTASSGTMLSTSFDLAAVPTAVAERDETDRYLLREVEVPEETRDPAKLRLRGRKVKLRLPLG